MVRDTHKVGGAWYKTYNDGLGNKNVIPISLIKECGLCTLRMMLNVKI